LKTGHIVWLHGGFPCGEYPDLRIARELIVTFINSNEKILADKGYRDRRYFINPTCLQHKQYLARHEIMNHRLKQFKILSERYRHPLRKHPICVHAVGNITQLIVKNEEPLFEI
jgi:hypothetical protein